ncbi:hypothetical protein PBI_SCTP2_304 [Salicola phage SCTP-2]|nr:hypothetical protein PBI_SCTP2_304 [Salicola phage SCTP-2]
MKGFIQKVKQAREVYEQTNYELCLDAISRLRNKGYDVSNLRDLQDIIAEARFLYTPLDDVQVGDGVSYSIGTDIYPCTVINRTPFSIKVRKDKAYLQNPEDLKFTTGGFAAHCRNTDDAQYVFEEDEQGTIHTFTRRKTGVWKMKGSQTKSTGGGKLIKGRKKRYDYNF